MTSRFGGRRAPNGGKRLIGHKTHQPITRIGIIHVNCDIDILLGTIRQNKKGYDLKAYPDFQVDSDSMVAEGEIFWAFSKSRSKKPNGKGAFNCKGRTSLNGFNLNGYHTKWDLYQDIRIIGIASSTPGDGDSSGEVVGNSGVSVTIGGTGSTLNISKDTFYPGDLAIAKAPSFKTDKQQEMQDSMPNQGNKRSKYKFTFIPSRFDPEKDFRSRFRYCLRHFFDPRYKSTDIQEIRNSIMTGKTSKISGNAQLAYKLAEVELTKVVQALPHLHRLGYITITGGAAGGVAPVTPTTYEAEVEAVRRLNNPAPGGAGSYEPLQNRMHHLVTLLGLASDEENQYGVQDKNLQKLLLVQTLGSLAPDFQVTEDKTVMDLLIEAFKVNYGVTDEQLQVFPAFYGSFRSTVAGQMWYQSIPSLHSLNTIHVSLLADVLTRLVFKVNNFSQSGDTSHYWK